MWCEVRTVQRVHNSNVAALDASADEEHCLVKISCHAFARCALPCPCQFEWRRKDEDLVLLRAPATFLEIAGGDAGATQEFLHLVAWDLGRLIEEAEELTRVRLGIGGRGFRSASDARIVVKQLVDTYQRLADCELAPVLDVN